MAKAAEKPKKDEDEEKPAGEGGAEGDAVELPKKKISGKKIAIFAVLGLVLIGAVVGGLFFAGILGGKKEGEHAEEAKAAEEHNKPPVYIELPEILVNLSSTGQRPGFLKLKVNLELVDEKERQAVTDAMPRVIDSFQLYLRELSREELQGTAGLERLREELRLRVSAAVAPVEVKDVLFTQMIFGQ
jgi:flagellar FliL protein